MMLSIVSLVLAVVSVALALVAIFDSRKINKDTSILLTRIETFSQNINERAMRWVEQLMFNKSSTQETTEKKSKSPTVKGKIVEDEIMNYLFEKKGGTFETIKKDLNLDFAQLKPALNRLKFGSLVMEYKSENGERIYYLPETKEEARKIYKPEIYEDIPF